MSNQKDNQHGGTREGAGRPRDVEVLRIVADCELTQKLSPDVSAYKDVAGRRWPRATGDDVLKNPERVRGMVRRTSLLSSPSDDADQATVEGGPVIEDDGADDEMPAVWGTGATTD